MNTTSLLLKNIRLLFFNFNSLVGTLMFFSSCNNDEAKEPYILGEGYGINSTSLFVNDLEATRTYYKDTLGFNVSEKVNKGLSEGSLSSVISFADMSRFELLSLNDSLKGKIEPSLLTSFLARYEGIGLYALTSSSADSTSNWLTSQGFKMDSIKAQRFSDETPTGWSWDTGDPQIHILDFDSARQSEYLPRFIQRADIRYPHAKKEWRTYYGYNRRYNEHANGVVGLKAIRIAVEDLEVANMDYNKIGFKELERNDSLIRYHLIRNQELHLISPQSSNKPLSKFLTTRGSGVFSLRFEVINLDSTYEYLQKRLPVEALVLEDSAKRLTVLQNYAFGVQLEFVQETEEQGILAKELRPDDQLDSAAILHAAGMYAKYCALCHGENREGYAADNAPSLRSQSLLASSKSSNFLRYTIQYGRSGTAMGGYLDRQGGPMEYIDVEILLQWLYESSGVEEPVEISREPVQGDIELGASIYAKNCTECHGENGEGISAPALGNPMLLATATDHFLRYAISEGRDGTPMIAFKDKLSGEEIDGVTAFLRSRASGWDVPETDTTTIPLPEEYILNPNNSAPKFNLREGRFLPVDQLLKAMQDSLRLVILDARSEVAWRQMHIPGSIPVPYYEEPENFVENLPNDSTWVVAYCACPHAASGKVINTLKRHGFKNTAIIDEGILVWAQLGYPVKYGR